MRHDIWIEHCVGRDYEPHLTGPSQSKRITSL